MNDHVALRDFIVQVMDERDLRYDQRFKAQERALKEASKELKGRLALLNELRTGVATKDGLDALSDRLNEIQARMDKSDGGKAIAVWIVATLIAIAGLAFAILRHS